MMKNDFSGGVLSMENNTPSGSYYKVDVIASLFGVTVRRVQQLTQEGIIATVKTSEGRRYDLGPTVKRYIRYLSDKAYGREQNNAELELREQKLKADIALKESQGELHQLKTKIASGQYIDKEEVMLDYARFFTTFKKFATSIPNRLITMMESQVDPIEARRLEKDLAGEINDLLGGFVIAGVVEPKDVKGIVKREKKKKKANSEVPGDAVPDGGSAVPETAG